MNEQELAEIEARADAALLPDWRVPEHNNAQIGRRRILSIECVWSGDDMYAQVTPFLMGDVPTAEFVAHAREDVPNLIAEVRRLRAAILMHRSQKADDRCWLDDDELYAALDDGIACDRRVGDKLAMLQNCARFIENRCKGGSWPSYAELETRIAELEEAQYVPGEFRCPECSFHLHKRVLNAGDGTVGIDRDTAKEFCPNDEAEMQRLTWKQADEESVKTIEALLKRIEELEQPVM